MLQDDRLDVKGIIDGHRAFGGPIEIVIDITNRCNNNCIACWTRSPLLRDKRASDHWRSLEFPFALIKEIIQDLHRLGAKRIIFSGGGDPLMHPNIMDLMELVKSLGMICSITTNFTLADDETLTRMIGSGIDEIIVSLWAGDPNTYARVHPNKTERTFHRIERLLHRLAKEKHSVTRLKIANVLFNMNYASALKMYDFAREVHADAVYFTLADPIPGYTDNLLLTADQTAELHNIMKEIERKTAECPVDDQIELDNFLEFMRRLTNPKATTGRYDSNIINTVPCYIGWMFCRLLPDGTVSPCCRGVTKPMGNLFKNSFEEIWFSNTYNEFRHKAKRLKKTNPYFHPIGCDTTCDNLHQILDMHKHITSIHPHLISDLSSLEE